jgi:hypothetical protein
MDKAALGHVLSEYLGFACQFSFYRLLHTHIVITIIIIYHPGLVQ